MSSARDTAAQRRRGASPGRRNETFPQEDNSNNNNNNNNDALAILDRTQRLFVKQHVEMMEAITGWETANEYTVLDQGGNVMYHCQEESGACMRQCCKSNRSFQLHVRDHNNNPVLLIDRPYRFFWQELLVSDVSRGNGMNVNVLGTIQRSFTCCSRTFNVIGANGQKLFRISSGIFSPWSFYLYDAETNAELGMIQKKWSGLAQELFTDADNFGIEYPRGLPREHKALLLAATFLIDFMYFEDNDMNSNRGRGRRGGRGGFGGGFRTNMF
jgi:hypothetical protein